MSISTWQRSLIGLGRSLSAGGGVAGGGRVIGVGVRGQNCRGRREQSRRCRRLAACVSELQR